jgi:hypothetical protein
MERQNNRYLVFKTEDVLTAFKQHEYSTATYHKLYDAYYTLTTAVESIRYELDKPKRKYVVISDSNPELYEEAWKLVEKYSETTS